ncbi:4-carboxymuconolactone decarboxylase [Curtobacterium sp. 9128]|uniref:carboxymuconolactone decarboxylase family protein n=1 Tax=Curtobacterium sp. 9128 TaxID=1793722 RepID=UPI0007D7220F|nr:carboxymuconolactone decarboxylase family protein [Curtobacterium sp. 9128]SBN63385.1 4-carboxymuconolactone decarboxylase [Curtobacterium sp. 9128]
MPADDAARAEHDTLFPNHASTFAETDTEFVAFFDDFAFDETLRAASMNRHDRLVVQLGAIIAVGAQTEFRTMLGAALDNDVTPIEVKEVVYQAVAYVGIARVVDFLRITNEVLTERGVELPLPGQSTTTPDDRFEVGKAKQTEIVGDRVESMYANAPDDALHFQRFLSANCFGDHYTRTGLDVRMRELLTFAMLVGLGGADGQVEGHVAANLHVGNSRADLLDVLTVLLPFVGYPRTLNGLAAVDEGAPAAA